MSKQNEEVNDYMNMLSGTELEWVKYFVEYMRIHHSDLEEVISFKMPTYKLGSGKNRNYIAFSVAKNHFSMHSMDFEYIAILKTKLEKPGNGKGCVNIRYENEFERAILLEGIEEIIKRKIFGTYGNK